MCGIAGAFSLHGPLNPAVGNAIKPMTDALQHRGPDGDGFFSDSWVALGHRRLAIIDRAGGAQPMANEDNSCWIVFNGEIYNHRALRQELISRGHRYRTASDTETILHAYEEYGTGCVERLEGMFAFAIYDARKRELFIARDRLGKKPLFHASLGNALLFASEIQAFQASPVWNDDMDVEALEGYLSLGYFVAPRTVYRHVRKLLPGHWLRVANDAVETRQYWDVERFDDDDRPEAEVLDDLEQLLEDVVRERLESEVPLGAFLSGGIDSGLVVSFMPAEAGHRVVTASVGFADRAHDELTAAGVTASHLRTLHFPHTITPNLDDILDPIAAAFGEPFADASAIPTYYVSKIARQHVTVALTGDGGDESFSGYDFRYGPHVVEGWARNVIPGAPGRAALRTLSRIWPDGAGLPKALRLKTIAANLAMDPADAYFSDLCFLKPHAARRIVGKDPRSSLDANPAYEAVTAAYRRCPSPHALQRAQYADLKIYLPNGPLVKVDRMSMLNSLEVRCPLLDRRVVEFAFRLPPERKFPRLRGKHLLRMLAARRLPHEISTLPKRGFTAPVGAWLAGPYAQQFADDVLNPRSTAASLFDLDEIRRRFDAHRAMSSDHSYGLWAIWMFERWTRAGRGVKALTS